VRTRVTGGRLGLASVGSLLRYWMAQADTTILRGVLTTQSVEGDVQMTTSEHDLYSHFSRHISCGRAEEKATFS